MVGEILPRSLAKARAICVRTVEPPANQIALSLFKHQGVSWALGRFKADSVPKNRSDQSGEGENVCIEQIANVKESCYRDKLRDVWQTYDTVIRPVYFWFCSHGTAR